MEPSAAWWRLGEKRFGALRFSAEWLDLPGEEIPLADESVDRVLVTFSLCTIPVVVAALTGMRRVLKPAGKLIFLEHGGAPDRGVAKWQDRLYGIWGKFSRGCNLNRKSDEMISAAGFRIDRHYAPGAPKIAGFVSAGVASR